MRPFSLVGAGLAWLYVRSLSLLTPDAQAIGRLTKHDKRTHGLQKRELAVCIEIYSICSALPRGPPPFVSNRTGAAAFPSLHESCLALPRRSPPCPEVFGPRYRALAPAPQHPRSEALPRNLPPRSCNCDPSPNLYLSILLLEHQMSEATERRARHRAERSGLQERALVELKFGQFNWGARSPVTEPSYGRAVGPF